MPKKLIMIEFVQCFLTLFMKESLEGALLMLIKLLPT